MVGKGGLLYLLDDKLYWKCQLELIKVMFFFCKRNWDQLGKKKRKRWGGAVGTWIYLSQLCRDPAIRVRNGEEPWRYCLNPRLGPLQLHQSLWCPEKPLSTPQYPWLLRGTPLSSLRSWAQVEGTQGFLPHPAYPLQSISKHVSLSSVSHYSKLLNLGKGSQEPQSVVKSNPGPTACDWCLKLGAALWDWFLNLGACANCQQLVS